MVEQLVGNPLSCPVVSDRKSEHPRCGSWKRGVKNVFYVYILVGYTAHSFQGPSKDTLTSSEDRLSWNNSERIFFWCHSSLFLCHPLHLCPGGRRGILRRAFSHPSSSNGIVSVHFYVSILCKRCHSRKFYSRRGNTFFICDFRFEKFFLKKISIKSH